MRKVVSIQRHVHSPVQDACLRRAGRRIVGGWIPMVDVEAHLIEWHAIRVSRKLAVEWQVHRTVRVSGDDMTIPAWPFRTVTSPAA